MAFRRKDFTYLKKETKKEVEKMKKVEDLKTLISVGKEIVKCLETASFSFSEEEEKVFKKSLVFLNDKVRGNMIKLFNLTGEGLVWHKDYLHPEWTKSRDKFIEKIERDSAS